MEEEDAFAQSAGRASLELGSVSEKRCAYHLYLLLRWLYLFLLSTS